MQLPHPPSNHKGLLFPELPSQIEGSPLPHKSVQFLSLFLNRIFRDFRLRLFLNENVAFEPVLC